MNENILIKSSPGFCRTHVIGLRDMLRKLPRALHNGFNARLAKLGSLEEVMA